MRERGVDSYNPIKFKPAFPEYLGGSSDNVFRRQERQRRRVSLFQRMAIIAVTAPAVMGLAHAWMSSIESDKRPVEVATGDENWGKRVENSQAATYMTDPFGGISEVEVRKLQNDSEEDVVGIVRPGCLVNSAQYLGPVYRVDGSDEGNLPVILKDGRKYRPWFFGEVPAFDKQEDGTFRMRTDKDGNAVILRGFVKGTNLKIPDVFETDAANCR